MAVKVKVKLTEPVWRTVGTREIIVELVEEAPTVGTVLDELARRYPNFGAEIFGGLNEGDYRYGLFLNDRIVGLAQRDEIGVKDGDEIFVILPIAGGLG